jgi:hypothetical protein
LLDQIVSTISGFTVWYSVDRKIKNPTFFFILLYRICFSADAKTDVSVSGKFAFAFATCFVRLG